MTARVVSIHHREGRATSVAYQNDGKRMQLYHEEVADAGGHRTGRDAGHPSPGDRRADRRPPVALSAGA